MYVLLCSKATSYKEFASVPCGIIMIIPAQQALLTAIIFA